MTSSSRCGRKRSTQRARARRSISSSSASCSMPAPARNGAIAMPRRAKASAAPRGWRWRASICSRAAIFLPMPTRSAARRCSRVGASSMPRHLRGGFQVTGGNPLVGLEGRAALSARARANSSASRPEIFARDDSLGPAAFSIISPPRPKARHDPGAADPVRTACSSSARSGRRGLRSAACRSAIAGGIRRMVTSTPPADSCRCTSCRNGSPIR